MGWLIGREQAARAPGGRERRLAKGAPVHLLAAAAAAAAARAMTRARPRRSCLAAAAGQGAARRAGVLAAGERHAGGARRGWGGGLPGWGRRTGCTAPTPAGA